MRMRAVLIGLLSTSLSGGALAQVIPPAPSKPAPTPAWEPPPPPEPPKVEVAPPPPPPMPAPDIIQRGADGKVVMFTEPVEEVAVAKLAIAPEKKALFDAVRAERSVLFQRRLASLGEKVLRGREGFAKVWADPNFDRSMDFLAVGRELMLSPPLHRQLQAAGVISEQEYDAADRAIKAYSAELAKELRAELETAPMSAQMQRTVNVNLRRMTPEIIRETDNLLRAAGSRWGEITAGATLNPTDKAAFAEAMKAFGNGSPTPDAVAKALSLLPPEEVKGLLERAAPPLPAAENRVIPDAPTPPPPSRPAGRVLTPAELKSPK